MLKLMITFTIFFGLNISIHAWDGYDYDSGSFVEIEEGNLVREGLDIEIYDYNDGTYKDVEVESISDYGGTVEVEVYDYDTGEYRTFEMED